MRWNMRSRVFPINLLLSVIKIFNIKVLKFANYASEKLFIVVSSVMTWALCNPKEKSNPNDELLIEEDRNIRKTFPKYQFLLSIEDQCLQANNFKTNLRTYCLISGLTYGHGEDLFFNFFKVKPIIFS